jgi:hypothetical protein
MERVKDAYEPVSKKRMYACLFRVELVHNHLISKLRVALCFHFGSYSPLLFTECNAMASASC